MKWFNNLKIKVKLITYFIIIAIFIAVVGVIGIRSMRSINLTSEDMYKNNLLSSQNIQKIQRDLLIIRSDYLLMLYEKDSSKINERLSEIDKALDESDDVLKDYKSSIQSGNELTLYNDLNNKFDSYKTLLNKNIDLIKAGNYADAITKTGEVTNVREKTEDLVQQLIDLNKKSAETKYTQNASDYKGKSIIMIAAIIVGFILAVTLGAIFANMISRPLAKLVDMANDIAEGNLDVKIKVKSKDEVGILSLAFIKMADNMNNVLYNISAASQQVASGARQVSSSSVSLSQGSTEQASSIQQLSASIEEISSQTKQNAENANEANKIAEITKENAGKGNHQMQEMLKSMDEINEASSNISKIIKVIDEIAFQTNILALNAAVEAARAGQHGKGFAVVAEEVRNLAERSANAAKETTAMIESSMKKVDGGTKIADETAKALNEIVEDVSKVANLVNSIASASSEQSQAIAQIDQGIMQVSQVVQTNSATSEESASASEELSSQAEMLRDEVSKFKLKKNYNRFDKTEELNPEVLKFFENINKKKKSSGDNEDIEPRDIDDTAKMKKIVLSDDEFGKY